MTGKSDGRSYGRASLSLIAGLLIVAGSLGAGYAWLTRAAPAPRAGPLEEITIATTEYVGTCPIIAARDKGYFASEGIHAVVQPHSSGKASMEAVLQGQANLGTVADIPIMFAGMVNRPIAVIATIFKTEKDHGIVGRRDKGVAAPGSLKGKRIGVTLNTSGHFTLDAFLNLQKLSGKEVTMRNYKPEELPLALAQGEVDAIASWEPFLETALTELGGNGVAFYGQDVYESLYSVVGMRDYIVRHPETVRKILRALARGEDFCSNSPDAAGMLIAAGIKLDAAKLKAAWPSYRFDIVLDQGLILALEDEARWAIKNKLATRTDMPNYLNYIYLDGMEAVMPSAVTIIH
ncbi:MAG: NrtA/SsuA/CpmA family ABC transporter substrate-binding protein [Pseudomonadota bacterium]